MSRRRNSTAHDERLYYNVGRLCDVTLVFVRFKIPAVFRKMSGVSFIFLSLSTQERFR